MADETSDVALKLAGVPAGTELENEHGTEVVVLDYDDKGNVVGFHKELKAEENK